MSMPTRPTREEFDSLVRYSLTRRAYDEVATMFDAIEALDAEIAEAQTIARAILSAIPNWLTGYQMSDEESAIFTLSLDLGDNSITCENKYAERFPLSRWQKEVKNSRKMVNALWDALNVYYAQFDSGLVYDQPQPTRKTQARKERTMKKTLTTAQQKALRMYATSELRDKDGYLSPNFIDLTGKGFTWGTINSLVKRGLLEAHPSRKRTYRVKPTDPTPDKPTSAIAHFNATEKQFLKALGKGEYARRREDGQFYSFRSQAKPTLYPQAMVEGLAARGYVYIEFDAELAQWKAQLTGSSEPDTSIAHFNAPSDDAGDQLAPDVDDDILKPTDRVEIINAYSDFYGAIIGTIFEIDPDHCYSYGVAYRINGEHHRHYFRFGELMKIHEDVIVAA